MGGWGDDGVFYNQWSGIFQSQVGSEISLGQLSVMDGSSNTLMYGETLGGKPDGQADFKNSWMGTGSLPTTWGLGDGSNNVASRSEWYTFGSRHPAVVQFAFGDGSTRGLRRGTTKTRAFDFSNFINGRGYNNDWGILMQLSGKKDGHNNDSSVLLD
jgi:hypothetical protein